MRLSGRRGALSLQKALATFNQHKITFLLALDFRAGLARCELIDGSKRHRFGSIERGQPERGSTRYSLPGRRSPLLLIAICTSPRVPMIHQSCSPRLADAERF